MPFYTVYHSYPLTDAHRDELAQRITTIHAQLFTRPGIFVNVRFVEYSSTPHYVGGKRRTGSVNLIVAQTRAGPSRTAAHHERLCKQLEDAWNQTVGSVDNNGRADSVDARRSRLTTVWILGSIAAAYEYGFMVPSAGNDRAWLAEILPELRKLVDEGGRPEIEDMLAELRSRDDFKDLMV